jgi:hypothetical protein
VLSKAVVSVINFKTASCWVLASFCRYSKG